MAYPQLSTKQQNAIAALLTEPTLKQAAEKAGCGLRTLHTWLDEPAFSKAYATARRAAVQQAVSRLQQHASTATTVLLTLMADKTNPAAVRLNAAKSILDYSI